MAARAGDLEGAPVEDQLSQDSQPTSQESIRQRAHEIYLQRGGQDGSELDDWLQAEREVLGQQ
jgi:hypothetical protein